LEYDVKVLLYSDLVLRFYENPNEREKDITEMEKLFFLDKTDVIIVDMGEK
jgi:hypothetical protein